MAANQGQGLSVDATLMAIVFQEIQNGNARVVQNGTEYELVITKKGLVDILLKMLPPNLNVTYNPNTDTLDIDLSPATLLNDPQLAGLSDAYKIVAKTADNRIVENIISVTIQISVAKLISTYIKPAAGMTGITFDEKNMELHLPLSMINMPVLQGMNLNPFGLLPQQNANKQT